MSKTIQLTQGYETVVDDEDYDWLMEMGKWCSRPHNKRLIYAAKGRRKDDPEKPKTIRMHRMVMNVDPDVFVDHINNDGLDNRKENLRICSHRENLRNQRPQNRNATSKYKGVGWHHGSKKWRAYIRINGKDLHLGVFSDELSAAIAYDEAAHKYFNDFARTNF